jgi:hypothetical protein
MQERASILLFPVLLLLYLYLCSTNYHHCYWTYNVCSILVLDLICLGYNTALLAKLVQTFPHIGLTSYPRGLNIQEDLLNFENEVGVLSRNFLI